MQTCNVLNQVLQQFVEECEQRDMSVDRSFANHFVHLLVRDARDGLDLSLQQGECKVQRFLEGALRRYADPLDATICNLKLTYFFKNCKELSIDYVKQRYEEQFKGKLEELIEDILLYPETSNKEQIDQMLLKMQVFIVACYSIGSPKNHVLLKLTRHSLNSVVGHGDLQNYVLKKRYHRLEYLKRLSATVCGILIFNNHKPAGEKENMRDIFADLEMAQRNTRESLDVALKHAADCREYASSVMTTDNIIRISVEENKVYCHWPIEKVRDINKFVSLYNVHERLLKQLLESYDKTKYLISVGVNKFQCVVDKINDVLKYRTAIESEQIFPHFVYLSEVWSSLVLYLNHLTELNKIKAQMEIFVTEALQTRFVEIVEQVKFCSKHNPVRNEPTFEELIVRTNKRTGVANFLRIKDSIKGFCALTLALTNGLIVPSHIQKKICENLDIKFGFSSIAFGKYAERHFEDFMTTLKNAIFTSVDLLLLFSLEEEILQQDYAAEVHAKQSSQRRNFETQTEMIVRNDLSVPNRINVTWNVWDFHRDTIRMANLRKLQTHSAQTTLTYGRRNAQNQANNTRRHF